MSGEPFIRVTCCRCNSDFGLPEPLYLAAKASEKIWFHCPYGHHQHYSAGETEADKLRRRAQRAEQNAAYWRDRHDTEERWVGLPAVLRPSAAHHRGAAGYREVPEGFLRSP